MKTAEEMRTATIEVLTAREKAAREAAELYAETVIAAAIEAATAEGNYKTPAMVKPTDIRFGFIKRYLETFGYKVEGNCSDFVVYW